VFFCCSELLNAAQHTHGSRLTSPIVKIITWGLDRLLSLLSCSADAVGGAAAAGMSAELKMLLGLVLELLVKASPDGTRSEFIL
jgi:hypothetical protein